MTNISDLYKESVAKLRLYQRILKENIVEERYITTALYEFYNLMSFFILSTRWQYAMSDIHENIWKLAVMDTYYYSDLCNFICRLAGYRQQIIHYEPDVNIGIGRNADRKLFTYLHYINYFGMPPNRMFWQDINIELTVPEQTNQLFDFANIHITTFPVVSPLNTSQTIEQQQDIYMTSDDDNDDKFMIKAINLVSTEQKEFTINKNKKIGHLYRKVASAFNKNLKDIKIIMNGRILRKNENVTDIFRDNENIIHFVIRDSVQTPET